MMTELFKGWMLEIAGLEWDARRWICAENIWYPEKMWHGKQCLLYSIDRNH